MSEAPSPTEVFQQAHAFVQRYEMAAFAALFAEDGVMEFPFAPPGVPGHLQGPDAIRAVLVPAVEASRTTRRIVGYSSMVIHETRDPEVSVAELELAGEVLATGERYRLPFIQVVRVRAGRIVSFRDYVNYAAMARLSGGAPRTLTGGG